MSRKCYKTNLLLSLERRREDLQQAVRVVDVHPVRAVREVVHPAPVRADPPDVLVRPHKRRSLCSDEIHREPDGLRLQHRPQVRRLVALVHRDDPLDVEHPRELPGGGARRRREVRGHPLRTLQGETGSRERIHERLSVCYRHRDRSRVRDGVPRVIPRLAPHVPRDGVQHPDLHRPRELLAELVHHGHGDFPAEGVSDERVRIDLEVLEGGEDVFRRVGDVVGARGGRRHVRGLTVASKVDEDELPAGEPLRQALGEGQQVPPRSENAVDQHGGWRVPPIGLLHRVLHERALDDLELERRGVERVGGRRGHRRRRVRGHRANDDARRSDSSGRGTPRASPREWPRSRYFPVTGEREARGMPSFSRVARTGREDCSTSRMISSFSEAEYLMPRLPQLRSYFF